MKTLNQKQFDWLMALTSHTNCVSYCDEYERHVIRRVLGNGMYDVKDGDVLNEVGKFYQLWKHCYGDIGKY